MELRACLEMELQSVGHDLGGDHSGPGGSLEMEAGPGKHPGTQNWPGFPC